MTSGVFRICLDNTMSRWTSKVVSLHVIIGEPGADPSQPATVPEAAHAVAQVEHLTKAEMSIAKLSALVEKCAEQQDYLRVREWRARGTAESNNSRVVWWAIVESALLVGVSVTQLVLIRKWFSDQVLPSRSWA